MIAHIAAERLFNQRLARPGPRTPEDLVSWFGAVQAQEYAGSKWALALRMPGRTTADSIDRAIDSGRILRTHVLRPTWHFVVAEDLGWMLQLTAPRVHGKMAYAYRFGGVDASMRMRAADVFARALETGEHLTRRELGRHLEREGLAVNALALAFLTIHAELEGVICSGARRGKELTYALLTARAPKQRRLLRDEALAELTRRYFRSHAPATIRDFVWWSGLTAVDAKRGLEIVGARSEVANGRTYWRLGRARPRAMSQGSVHLVPIYDEYLVAYRDLDAVPRMAGASLGPAVIIDGQVAGSWKSTVRGDVVTVTVTPRRRLAASERDTLERTVNQLGRHLEKNASLALAKTRGL